MTPLKPFRTVIITLCVLFLSTLTISCGETTYNKGQGAGSIQGAGDDFSPNGDWQSSGGNNDDLSESEAAPIMERAKAHAGIVLPDYKDVLICQDAAYSQTYWKYFLFEYQLRSPINQSIMNMGLAADEPIEVLSKVNNYFSTILFTENASMQSLSVSAVLDIVFDKLGVLDEEYAQALTEQVLNFQTTKWVAKKQTEEEKAKQNLEEIPGTTCSLQKMIKTGWTRFEDNSQQNLYFYDPDLYSQLSGTQQAKILLREVMYTMVNQPRNYEIQKIDKFISLLLSENFNEFKDDEFSKQAFSKILSETKP